MTEATLDAKMHELVELLRDDPITIWPGPELCQVLELNDCARQRGALIASNVGGVGYKWATTREQVNETLRHLWGRVGKIAAAAHGLKQAADRAGL